MDNNKKLKLFGIGAALAGFAVSMISDSIKEKTHSEELKKAVAEQVSKQLAEAQKVES